MDKQYKGIEGRDIKWLDHQGDYYIRHVSAMTSEGLHSKSAIAAELAYRDWRIDNADTALAAAEARIAEQDQYIAELRHYNSGLADESFQQQERIAALEKALEPFAEEARKGLNFDSTCPVDLAQVFSITVGDLRHAAALLKEKE